MSEFWTTMGQGSVWRPVVYLVASVPVQVGPGLEFDLVTTLTTMTGQTDDATRRRLVPGTEHPWHQIGGHVFRQDAAGPLAPVALARVLLQLPGDDAAVPPRPAVSVQETRTDDRGRYQFVFAGPAPPGPWRHSRPRTRWSFVTPACGPTHCPLTSTRAPRSPHDIRAPAGAVAARNHSRDPLTKE
jgi:hypothetical protein